MSGGSPCPICLSQPPATEEDPNPEQTAHCGFPEGRVEWNADAAAAAALQQMRLLAALQGEDLNIREWGCYLWIDDFQNIQYGPITAGEFTFQDPPDTGLPSVTLSDEGIPAGRIIGAVHTHQAGAFVPSYGDLDAFHGIQGRLAGEGRGGERVRFYVGALDLVPAGGGRQTAGLRVNDERTIDEAVTQIKEGAQVNPLAEPCP